MVTSFGPKYTATDIAKLPFREKAYHHTLGALPGFTVYITPPTPSNPQGSRSYHVWFRTRWGRPRRMFLGKASVVTPMEAYRLARDILARRDAGFDPAQEMYDRFAAERRKMAETMDALVPRYLADRAGLRSVDRIESTMKRQVMPNLPALPVGSIERRHVAEMVDRIKAQNGPSAARAALSWLSAFYGWLAEKGVVSDGMSPCRHVVPPKGNEGTRVFDEGEIALYWHGASRLPSPYSAYLRVLLLVGARRCEVSDARWQEIDLDRGEWLVPAARMKGGRDHLILLSPTTAKLIGALPKIGPCVFSTAPKGDRSISNFRYLKDQLVKAMTEVNPTATAAMPAFTLHACRRTMRSHMSRLGIAPHVAERCLDHIVGSKVERLYDRYRYAAEKREAWARWDAEVNRITGPQLVAPTTASHGTAA